MNIFDSALAREQRLLFLMKEIGSNTKTWGSDAIDTYIKQPVQKGNVVRTAAGPLMLGLSTVAELPDYIVAGALDYPLDPPKAVPMARMRRDAGELLGNVVKIRPVRALVNALQLLFTDLTMDSAELLLGYEHRRNATRSQVYDTLAA